MTQGPKDGETDLRHYIMIGIALVLLLVAYLVYNGKSEEELEQLTLDSEIKSGKMKDVIDEDAQRDKLYEKLDK